MRAAPQRQRVIRVPNAQGFEERRETRDWGAGPARPDLRPETRPQPRSEAPPETAPEAGTVWRADRRADGGIRILREVTPQQYRP